MRTFSFLPMKLQISSACDVTNGNVVNHPTHQLLALLASQHQNTHDRVAIEICDSFGAANGVAFDQQAEVRRIRSCEMYLPSRAFLWASVKVRLHSGQRNRRKPFRCFQSVDTGLALLASHCLFCRFHCALHDSIIQLSLVVCQRKTARRLMFFCLYFEWLRRLKWSRHHGPVSRHPPWLSGSSGPSCSAHRAGDMSAAGY